MREKKTEMTNDEDRMCKNNSHFLKKSAKSPLFRPKMALLSLGKRPKTTLISKVKQNLKKKKMTVGMFATNPVPILFLHLRHKRKLQKN